MRSRPNVQFETGETVEVRLDNGYVTMGVIVRKFKNGGHGVRETNGTYHTRPSRHLRKVQNAQST